MREITIKKDSKADFKNAVGYCVGTGRMGLALHKEYMDQLKLVQDEIGFSFIRGHGLFHEDTSIYCVDREGVEEYNFTYLDRVVDAYLEVNIRPFIELGFMPKKMASGEQTVFYWEGNTTPPADYDKWNNLVKATLSHLIDRYGEEVLTWPVEVWNEPNLPGFWENADMEKYFELYMNTATAVKEVDERFKVGGPAICGGMDEKWMRGFLEFCKEKNPPLDFITRHHYTTEVPKDNGHYGYPIMEDFKHTIDTLRKCKALIGEYDNYKDLPFYITEFNTSYIPNCPMHDTNLNAAFIAATLAEIGDYANGYSYWTFGDVFEERGVPFSLFHGGFGMLANGSIKKPTFYTFKFFKQLEGECVYKDDCVVVVKDGKGNYKGVAWNSYLETKSDKIDMSFDFELDGERYCLIKKTVDEMTCNPLKVWHDMGEPTSPSKLELELLKEAAKPLIESEIVTDNKVELSVNKNGVIYFELNKAEFVGDRGYDYDFYKNM